MIKIEENRPFRIKHKKIGREAFLIVKNGELYVYSEQESECRKIYSEAAPLFWREIFKHGIVYS